MKVQILTGREAIRDIRAEWNPLLAESSVDSVFLTCQWIHAWLETLGAEVELAVITVRDGDGRLCGLLPLYRTRYSFMRTARLCGLRVMGDGTSGGEYGGLIARRAVEGEVAAAAMQCLSQSAMRWDMAWIPNMGPTERHSDTVLAAARQLGLRFRTRPAEFARIALRGSFEEYLQTLPPKVRYQMRRAVERAEGEHGAALVSCEDDGAIESALGDLQRLHEMRWSRRGQAGSFTDPRKRAFYRAMARAMLKAGWLRLDFLQVGGAPVAAQIGFAYHGVFYELQRGFDPLFPKIPAGVGAALRCMVIRRCLTEGLHTYDFLGECTEDKRRAGATATVGRDILICGPTVRGALLAHLNLWPTGRYLTEDRAHCIGRTSGSPATDPLESSEPSAALA